MAKTENNQDSNNSDCLLTKTLLVNENNENINEIAVPSESESDLVKANCPHVSKSVDANAVRKNVSRLGFTSLKCSNCKVISFNSKNENDLSLCLKCGVCNCSTHAQQHYESPHSDPHNLLVKINDWSVWCYKCDTEVPVESGKLKEAIIILKKEQGKFTKFISLKPIISESDTIVSSVMEPSAHCSKNNDSLSCMSVTVGQKLTSNLPFARGLTNLGNTCFFNSVLQCLAQTPFLLELLMEISEAGEKAILNIDNNSQLLVELEKWGPVTEALALTLTQITHGSGGAYPPAHLLEALRKRYRQFIGYNQHDSHELLRQLLDSVKTEDIRRYQVHILQHYGLSRKTNPDEIDEKKRAMAKKLNQKLTEIVNIRPDPVFKGTLVSTHRCMKCHQKSEVTQLPSVIRRTNDFNEKPKSKHQKKKEKEAARKANRLAKIKKKLKDEQNKNLDNPVIKVKDVYESGYSSSKASSPVQNNTNQISNGNNKNEILAEALKEINSSSLSNINGDIETNKSESNSNSSSSDVFNEENFSSINNEVVQKSEPDLRFQLLNPVEQGFSATLQPPSEYEENSIQACLSEFTACEVLTGNNRLKCESCTERQAKVTNEKKPVYQPITKQLLIKSPPPVLILHLKRFEMRNTFSFNSVSLRKAEKVITFPLILDIGSFCSVNCEKLLVSGQKRILYSLYGVVEHSGSLNAGHYVAYVKVRKPVEKNSYRRLFLPTTKSNQLGSINVDDLEEKISEHRNSECQWYYISDSYVRAISEEEVLNKQAYLLFYERIL
ncbi:hypothetical protein PGB90_007883 [Kerria lacca]